MAETKLPVKIRMSIRDSWDAPKCPFREAINALSKLLGTSVEVIVDWGMLWSVLSPQYPDPTTFIPCIEEAARVWAECLHERLDSDSLEEWTDEFLEKAKTASGITLELGVSENEMDRPEAIYEQSRGRLLLVFPRNSNGRVYLIASAVDEDDWSVVPPTSGPSTAPPRPAVAVSDLSAPQVQAEAPPEKLPSLSSLGRPEVLFESSTPYLIYVRKYGNKELHIEGSHHGSLTLICEYFQKWVLEIEKQTSLFGLNAGFDYMKITCNRWELLNPTPFLAFIEIVLKYKLVEASSGVTWFYRRDTKFV
ncbi:hypothetical protein DRE_07282 [Drechslerella stenobrocha 248]|uniref:Uncharacterized protein n=1 Tax=Drechslerella stenobrocha 248 TaxID=1043628 RepID=W7HVB0_9PEZI|nr:hypothetical protein DRE_07282 [Drechslerella stenobrocha 248]